MRLWVRFVLTLVLGPLLWWVLTGYVATQQGTTFGQWLGDVPKALPTLYISYTIPALLLCVLLLGLEQLLKLGSIDLATVLLSPLVGYALAWVAVRFVPEPHVQAAGAALFLFACYGLVWGFTIREPLVDRVYGDDDGRLVDVPVA